MSANEENSVPIAWDNCGKFPLTLNDILENIDPKKLKRNIPQMELFHNCTFNDVTAYGKKGRLYPRTNADENQHVFCSYGKGWYRPRNLKQDSLLDLPFTFVFRTDPLLKDVIRVLVFDGGFAKDLHLRRKNGSQSDFSFLRDVDVGNFLLKPSIEYVNSFIEVLYGSFLNYCEARDLKFNSKQGVLDNPQEQFKDLFQSSEDLLNKVAWIVTQTQYGDSKLVSTIEFFFKEIEPKRINVAKLYVHPKILEKQEGNKIMQEFISKYEYTSTHESQEEQHQVKMHFEPDAFERVTQALSDWDVHLEKVNGHHADYRI